MPAMLGSPLFVQSRKQDIHTEERRPSDPRDVKERVRDPFGLEENKKIKRFFLKKHRSTHSYFVFLLILSVLRCITGGEIITSRLCPNDHLTTPAQVSDQQSTLMLTCQQFNSPLTFSQQQSGETMNMPVHRRRGSTTERLCAAFRWSGQKKEAHFSKQVLHKISNKAVKGYKWLNSKESFKVPKRAKCD